MTNKNAANMKPELQNKSNALFYQQKYPFSYENILSFSQFFQNNQIVQKPEFINICNDLKREENMNVSDSSMKTFICHCQHQNYHVTREGAIYLYQLAKRYEINSLIKELEEYFSNYSNDIVIQFLIKIQNPENNNFNEEEELISNNFIDYIKDDALILVPIPFLYKILEKYVTKHSNLLITNHEIIEFLIKYLSKHGRESSILFSFVNFGNDQLKYFNQLITEYSNIIDFNFINMDFMKRIIHNEQTRNENEKENCKKIEEIQNQLNQTKNEIYGIKNWLFIAFLSFILFSFLLFSSNSAKIKCVQNKFNNINQKFFDMSVINQKLAQKNRFYETIYKQCVGNYRLNQIKLFNE